MKSDAEIVKQKARQMLIEKDEDLERMRSNKASGGQQAHNSSYVSPGKNVNFLRPSENLSETGDSGSLMSEVMVESVMEADNSQLMMDTSA